jgi:hypothetical protein
MITVLSPCWWSILLTTTWQVWYTDEHVVTLLAEHTILLPGRRLAFSLYHGGFVSWRVQAQEPLGQSTGSVKVS